MDSIRLVLAQGDQKTPEEIAAALGMTTKQVEHYLQVALDLRLRERRKPGVPEHHRLATKDTVYVAQSTSK